MPRADKPYTVIADKVSTMSKQPTRAGAIDFTYDVLGIATLNALKKAREILDFKGEGEQAKIKRPGTTRFTPVKNKENTKFLKKKFKQNPQAFTPEKPKKPEEETPEVELKDKPSDIRRQEEEARLKAEAELKQQKAEEEAKKKAAEEAKARDSNHELNKLAKELVKERNPLRRKIILRKLRDADKRIDSRDKPKFYVNAKGVMSTAKNQRDAFQKNFIKDGNKFDKAKVTPSSFMDEIETRITPTEQTQPLLYFIASAVNRAPEEVIEGYITDPLAFITELRSNFNLELDEDDREMYNRMAEQKIKYSDITPAFVEKFQKEVIFEQMDKEEAQAKEQARQPPEPEFGLPEGAPRFARQEVRAPRPEERRARTVSALDTGELQRSLSTALSDREIKERIQDWIEVNSGRLQRAGQTTADVIRMISQIPALRDKRVWIPIIAGLVAAYYFSGGETQETQETQEAQETQETQEEPETQETQEAQEEPERPKRFKKVKKPPKKVKKKVKFTQETQEEPEGFTEGEIDETDPVKVEAELNRLREQLQNLRVAKLNEEQEEQSFKERRKFRPEIREFNPERLNYFVSQEHEDLEKKELIQFAYIPEVSQAGVYTEDYKDNPLVMDNIRNQDIRFSNTQKQPMDYHPVGTYMLLDRIGKQMLEIRKEFNKAVASMRHQQRAVDDQFNQVWIPRIAPVEQPRKRRYRDMTDDAMKFASEPIVSLPKIDDKGVGATSAARDFTTSYSYRRHYVK